jgi:hypothetical protein
LPDAQRPVGDDVVQLDFTQLLAVPSVPVEPSKRSLLLLPDVTFLGNVFQPVSVSAKTPTWLFSVSFALNALSVVDIVYDPFIDHLPIKMHRTRAGRSHRRRRGDHPGDRNRPGQARPRTDRPGAASRNE